MKDMQFSPASIATFLHRFHLVISVVLLAVALSIIIFMLNGIISKASDTSALNSGSNTSNFDEATIDRINELKTSSEPSTPLNFSGGRINPFSE